MVIRSCSSFFRGLLISRAAWRRHYPLFLALRPPVPPPSIPQPRVHFSSSSSSRRSTKRSSAKTPMDSSAAGEPFYVVRKGDVIGIYKTLSECQAQVSNSVCDPSVTVFKGYSLLKDTEEYLAARGLRNALYTIDAADARDELFDDLVPCPFQQPDGTASSTLKWSHETETGPSKKQPKVDEQEQLPDCHLSCILEFDGASKGNPGKAGAGAIIKRLDGSVIAQLREGLGIATNNAAEYRALILGLKYAAKKGFKYIRAQGDSKLVCNQVQDLWRARNDNMAGLCKKVKELKGTFQLFQIRHVLRLSCILEFDGASKGNPGKAGAGAIIKRLDGSVIAQLREGLGIATNNAAEYRALILGLKYAAKKGFKYIRAQGDSKLVCNQVQDLWRARNDNMAGLCKKVKELKGTFQLFQIRHVLREFNSAADAQANFAVQLPVGEIQEQSNFPC